MNLEVDIVSIIIGIINFPSKIIIVNKCFCKEVNYTLIFVVVGELKYFLIRELA